MWSRSLLALAVLGLLQTSRGAGIGDFSFVHCSDIHVPPGVTRRTGVQGGPQFGSAEVVAQIAQLREPIRLSPYDVMVPPPAFAIATGDLTEFGGLNGWWDDYLNLWQGAAFPVYHISGNHDSTWACQRHSIRKLHGQAFYSFDLGGCHFVAIDSATPQDPRPSFGEEELIWLREDLRRVGRETPVFLYCHHPIDSTEFASLYERDRLLDTLRPYNVTLLLVGHGHSVQHRVVAGVDQVMGGSTFGNAPGYSIVTVQGGTLRVAYRRADEPAANRAVLERVLKPRGDYPTIEINNPRERQTVSSDTLLVSATIDRLDVSSGRWQADDIRGREGALVVTGGRWQAELDTRSWEAGAHYVRLTFQANGTAFQRTAAFYTTGGDAVPSPAVRWRAFMAGSSKSKPAVEGDTVYVASSDGGLYALDRSTGERRWRYSTGGEVLAGPLAREGVVYFGSGDGGFYAVGRHGRRRWRYDVGAPVYSSAVLAQGMVLFGANDARFYALDAETGSVRWVSEAPDYTIESRPFVDGETVYFGAWDNYVYALNLSDGSLNWKTPGEGSRASLPGVARYYSPADAGPVVAGGRVYIADRAYALTVMDTETGAVLETRKNISAVGMAADRQAVYLRGTDGNLTKIGLDGKQIWSRPAHTSFLPTSPFESDGVVYSAGATGRIVALRASDGERVWEYQATPRLYVFSDPAAQDGTAFISGMDGSLTALR